MSKISPDPTMVWSVKVVETRSTLQDQSIQPKISASSVMNLSRSDTRSTGLTARYLSFYHFFVI
ncbi:hypothetical protein Hanom_Chr14g01253321 [Helianthus anomalus]